jgi:hypothetical protein
LVQWTFWGWKSYIEFKDYPRIPQCNVAKTLGLPEILAKYAHNIALQGELLGEGVQGNKYKLKGYCIKFFSVFNIDKSQYLAYREMVSVLTDFGLEKHIVPIISEQFFLPETVDALESYVETENNGMSRLTPTTKRE